MIYSYILDTSDINVGKLAGIDIRNDASQVVSRVKYTYFGSSSTYDSDNGSPGDLILVEKLRRASDDDLTSSNDSDFSITETLHYRYNTEDYVLGTSGHQIKMVFENEAISRILESDSTLNSPADILDEPDSYAVNGGNTLSSHASREITYYEVFENLNSPIDTPWGGTNDLLALYGCQTSLSSVGRVKSETIRSGCGSCGSSSPGLTHTFYYMKRASDNDADGVRYVTVQDTTATSDGGPPDDIKVRRTVYGLNYGLKLTRKLIIEQPTSPVYFGYSWLIDDVKQSPDIPRRGMPIEERMPSAHEVDTAQDVIDFFNPATGSNDADTLADSGLIYVYETNDDGHRTGTLVKDGKNGTPYYTSATDWGDSTNDQPGHLPVATYRYSEKKDQTSGQREQGDKTTYSYTFWDTADTQIKTKTTTYPVVTTAENGSGVATTEKQYFDQRGRVRWEVDGNGYVSYHSYDPDTGLLAYTVRDVDTATLSSEITAGSSGLWDAWDDGSGGTTIPTGFTAPTSGDRLGLVTKYEYDDLGRRTKMVESDGTVTYLAYGDDRQIVFPAWDAGLGRPLLPIQVYDETEAGDPDQVITVDPTVTLETSGGVPIGFDTEPSQSDYVTWVKNTYTDTDLLQFTDRYYDIPSSGSGTVSANYHRTAYLYDAQGRREYVIQTVSGSPTASGVEQVTQTVYDAMDRVAEVKRGVSSASHSITLSYDAIPTTLKTVSKRYYDGADASTPLVAGNGYLTRVETYFADGTAETDRTTVLQHYDFRGRLRGIEPEIAPYTVLDLDWAGQALAAGSFTAAPTSWSGLAEDYAETTTTDRGALTTTEYDSWGRAFRSLTHGIVASSGAKSKAIESLRFFDATGNRVAQTITGRAGTEYAYDGADRLYQTRTVSRLSGQDGGSYFTSGQYNYQSPPPETSLANMTGGDDHVLALDHLDLDADGKVETRSHWAVEHEDAGLSASTPDFIQSTTHTWYDDADRPIATAVYGTNDAGGDYEYATAPTRGVSPPASSTDTVLLTERIYESATGRLQDVITPLGSGGSAPTQTNRTVYDDLGRTIATIENHNNAAVTPGSPPSVSNSGGTTSDLDRVTLYEYNGIDQIVKLTAVDPDGDGLTGDNQDTAYLYESTIDASWLTQTIYPDSTDTSSSGYDQIARAYHLDGTVNTFTKQKATSGNTATVITFDYDDARRPAAERVTTVGTGVDDTVRAQVILYDGLGRVSSRRAYAESDPTLPPEMSPDTPLYEVALTYGDYGELLTSAQAHDGAATTGTPEITYAYDDTDSGADGVLDHALRPTFLTYPNGRQIEYRYGDLADTSTWDDKNAYTSRPDGILERTPGTLVTKDNPTGDNPIVLYQRLGNGRLAVKDYPTASLRLDRHGQTTGSYDGYDRFGRVAQQRWEDYSGTETAVFDIAHDYDQASNRLNAVRSEYPLASQAYTHDGLNRLASFEAGEYDDTADEIDDLRKFDRQVWDLDQLGNQRSVTTLEDPSGDTNPYTESTFTAANEINIRSVQATRRVSPGDAFEDSATASLWSAASGSGSYTIDSGGSGVMNTTSTGTKLILFSEESAGSATVSVEVGSVTANQYAGLVFGYLSSTSFYRVVYWQDGTFKLMTAFGNVASTTATGTLTGPVTVSVDITERGVVCRLQESGSGNDVAELSHSFPKGVPIGRVGVYARPNSDSTPITFDDFVWTEGARSTALTDAWENHADNIYIDASTDRMVLDANASMSRRPALLRGVRGDRFRVDFAVRRSYYTEQEFRFHFNTRDPEDTDYLVSTLASQLGGYGKAPVGYEVERGSTPTLLSATATDSNTPSTAPFGTVWVRVESDGTDLTVKQATSKGGLDSAGICYETTSSTDRFEMSGGQIGFSAESGYPEVLELEVYLDLDENGLFTGTNELQHDESLTLDGNGYADTTFEYDAAGNLTYDGVFHYVYDAWNRLVEIRKAVSSSQDGATIAVYGYDALGRRITRAIQHAGDDTLTYHDYWSSNWQLLETHDASENVLKQHVWGLEYIDELIQIAVNRDVYVDTAEDECEQVYFVLQDAHYNVIGLAAGNGHLVERYEYTPYGERKVYSQPQPFGDYSGDGKVGQADYDVYVLNYGDSTASGSDIMYADVDGNGIVSQAELDKVLLNWGQGYAEDDQVTRGVARGALVENKNGLLPYAVCEVGYQGSHSDITTGLGVHRIRKYSSRHKAWHNREPLGYIDGLSSYQLVRSQPLLYLDPSGLSSFLDGMNSAVNSLSNDVNDALEPIRTDIDAISDLVDGAADFIMGRGPQTTTHSGDGMAQAMSRDPKLPSKFEPIIDLIERSCGSCKNEEKGSFYRKFKPLDYLGGGSLTRAMVGGYTAEWTSKVSCCKGTGVVTVTATNTWGTGSGTRNPFLDYHGRPMVPLGDWGDRKPYEVRLGRIAQEYGGGSAFYMEVPGSLVGDNVFGDDGPLANKTHTFTYTKNISFKSNKNCND